MTTQSDTWKNLFDGCSVIVSDEDLARAHAEVNGAIHCLERMYGHKHQMWDLDSLSEKIAKIQSDRQAANRPELSSMVKLSFTGSQMVFYGGPSGDWTAGPNEQTGQLRKQLEAIYETTTMVKR